jgi:putative FmdB family regulatory protein
MPIYVFECENCRDRLEVKRSITEKIPNRRKCPACKKLALRRVIFAPHVYNKPGDGEISVGLLADRNTERMSSSEKELVNNQHKTGPAPRAKSKGKNFWEPKDKAEQDKLDRATTPKPGESPEQFGKRQKNFIETGDS